MYRVGPVYYTHSTGYIVPLVTGVVHTVQCTVRYQAATRRGPVTPLSPAVERPMAMPRRLYIWPDTGHGLYINR